jgi:uncharacterized protein YjhX (UPF0386 family)
VEPVQKKRRVIARLSQGSRGNLIKEEQQEIVSLAMMNVCVITSARERRVIARLPQGSRGNLIKEEQQEIASPSLRSGSQ